VNNDRILNQKRIDKSNIGTLLLQEGEFIATFILKAWGERIRLRCYFLTDDGKNFYLNAWRVQSGERKDQYCPRDSAPNFRHVKPGTRWLITTKRSKNGNVFWSTAEELLAEESR